MGKRTFTPTVRGGGNSEPAYFHGWADWKEGDYVVGEYVDMYERSYKGKMCPNFKVRVEETSLVIKDKLGKKVDIKGKLLVLNGVGQLNKFMEKLNYGDGVEVVYDGKKKGGKEGDDTKYHTFSTLLGGKYDGNSEDNDAL